MSMPATQKQLDYIKDISDELGYEFTEITKAEASEWLSKYVPEYKHYCFNRQVDYEAHLDEIDARRDW